VGRASRRKRSRLSRGTRLALAFAVLRPLVVLLALLPGCLGAVTPGEGSAWVPATASSSAPSQGPGPSAAPAVQAGFALPREQVRLLPFPSRLNLLAGVLGVAVGDPLLAPILAARFDLGASDYAAGIKPDLTWTAAKVAAWVRALQPACTALEARLPLPAALSRFVPLALGRDATADDAAALEAAVDGLGLSASEQHQACCLALLSSTEFLTR
jgi:hypothetical protein